MVYFHEQSAITPKYVMQYGPSSILEDIMVFNKINDNNVNKFFI